MEEDWDWKRLGEEEDWDWMEYQCRRRLGLDGIRALKKIGIGNKRV